MMKKILREKKDEKKIQSKLEDEKLPCRDLDGFDIA